jgi:SPP1 family phage portal protein
MMLSDFENNMQEDSRNTILIIKNYDGQNLAEFRHNLATFGAVKVKTIDGSEGGVDALQVEVNAENYKAILEVFKKAIIENAMAYDAKDDRMNGTPNQMNIQSMYSDIDLDANNMETEFQASFEELLEFVNMYFINKGLGDFRNEKVDVIFNRNMMFNETEAIDNCVKSVGLLSDETIVAQHPWVTDVKGEIERKKEEKQENLDEYANAFTPINTASNEGGEGDEE